MSLSYQRKKDAGETQKARAWIFKSFVWFVSKLDSKVAEIDADVSKLVPRVEVLERDYWKRGGNGQ